MCHKREVNKSNGFLFFLFFPAHSGVASEEDRKIISKRERKRERSREEESGRECAIIEQESSATVLEWHAGPRSHQKCNDSKRENMIFSRQWLGPSGNQ